MQLPRNTEHHQATDDLRALHCYSCMAPYVIRFSRNQRRYATDMASERVDISERPLNGSRLGTWFSKIGLSWQVSSCINQRIFLAVKPWGRYDNDECSTQVSSSSGCTNCATTSHLSRSVVFAL